MSFKISCAYIAVAVCTTSEFVGHTSAAESMVPVQWTWRAWPTQVCSKVGLVGATYQVTINAQITHAGKEAADYATVQGVIGVVNSAAFSSGHTLFTLSVKFDGYTGTTVPGMPTNIKMRSDGEIKSRPPTVQPLLTVHELHFDFVPPPKPSVLPVSKSPNDSQPLISPFSQFYVRRGTSIEFTANAGIDKDTDGVCMFGTSTHAFLIK